MDVGEFLKSRKILCDCFCAWWLFWWIVFFLFVFSAAYNKWNQSEVKITQFLSRSLESRRRLKFDASVGSRSGRSQPLHHSEKIGSLGSWISQRKGHSLFWFAARCPSPEFDVASKACYCVTGGKDKGSNQSQATRTDFIYGWKVAEFRFICRWTHS